MELALAEPAAGPRVGVAQDAQRGHEPLVVVEDVRPVDDEILRGLLDSFLPMVVEAS
jgi:hypothetical protein